MGLSQIVPLCIYDNLFLITNIRNTSKPVNNAPKTKLNISLLHKPNNSEETEQLKALFKKNLFRYNLSSYIKIDEIDMIKEQSKLELEMQKKKQNDEDTM